MKKTYISPVANTYNVDTTTILAGSEQTVENAGSNKNKGITQAEGKAGSISWDDED